MKKFILAFLIAAFMVTLCAGLIACSTDRGSSGHNWNKEWTHDDRGHWHECLDDCGQITDYDSHVWEFKSTIDYPTCNDAGLGLYVCKVCGEEKKDEIEATGDHFWVVNDRLEPNCYSKGYIAHTCAICDTFERVEIPATEEHTFVKSLWVSVGDEGHAHPCAFRDQGCTATSETESHNKKSKPTTIEPTDFDDGSISYDCIECGHRLDVEVLPATHIPVSMEISLTAYRDYMYNIWTSKDKDPVVTENDGEYYVTLFSDYGNGVNPAYPYKIVWTGKYSDGSTDKINTWAYSSKSGVSGYIVSRSTGELSRLSVGFPFVYSPMGSGSAAVLRCKTNGEYRVAFIFETGDVDRNNIKQRLILYFNISVVTYTAEISFSDGALPVVLDTQPIMYLECSLRRSED